MLKKINVAQDFSPVLRNRNKLQTDGLYTGEEFRETFLKEADCKEWWSNKDTITLDFDGVITLGPSWANEAFAYFSQYGINFEKMKKKFIFLNLTEVKKRIIENEVNEGHRGVSLAST